MAIDYGSRTATPSLPDELLEELEKRLDRLKVFYEQYFMGMLKLEPRTSRADVQRRLIDLAKLKLRNTTLRYRFNTLNQRFSVYSAYWGRTVRAIEEGRYYRDVARVGREALRRGVEVPDEILRVMTPRMREKLLKEREKRAKNQKVGVAPLATGEKPSASGKDKGDRLPQRSDAGILAFADDDLNASFDDEFDQILAEAALLGGHDDEAIVDRRPVLERDDDDENHAGIAASMSARVKPARRAPVAASSLAPHAADAQRTSPDRASAGALPRASVSPPAKSALPPGMDEAATRELFHRFVQAKRLLGQSTERITYEQIAKTIREQAPPILEKHQAKEVSFSVTVKDDRVILTAKPKRS